MKKTQFNFISKESSNYEKVQELEKKALDYLRKNKYNEAKELFEKVLQINSCGPFVWRKYAETLVNLNQLDKAELWLDKIINDDGCINLAKAYCDKAYIYLLRNNLNDSIKFLEKAFQEDLRYIDRASKDPKFIKLHKLKEFQNLIRPSKEFKVDEYITLKLFGRKTVIYVFNELFSTCHTAVLNIPTKEIESYYEYDSIDEILQYAKPLTSEKLDTSITPEQEFWVHCSNIQAWVEHNYDTRILQDYIAFGILKKLTDNGVKEALTVLKEEIIKRLKSGWINILMFFLQEKYMAFLNEEELFFGLLNDDEAVVMEEISMLTPQEYTLTVDIEDSYLDPSILRPKGKLLFYIEDGFVSHLEILLDINNQKIIDYLSRLPRLDQLYIYYSYKSEDIGVKLQNLGFEIINYSDDFIVLHKRNY